MNKRGFFFTVFLLLFLSALALFVYGYKEWFQDFQAENVVVISQGVFAAFLLDDLSQDLIVLHDLQDISFFRASSNVSVSFTGGFNSSVNYTGRFQRYEQFIEQNYSSLVQVPIGLDSVSYGFAVPLYGVSTSFNSSTFFIYTGNSSLLKQVNVTVRVANTSAFTSNTSPDATSGDTFVSVQILDSAGRQVLSEQKILSSSASNNPFHVNFSTSVVDISFQSYNGRSGTLWLDYDSPVQITALTFVYQELNRTIAVIFNTSASFSLGEDFAQSQALYVAG